MKKINIPYIHQYLSAAARLYGSVTLEVLWKIYNRHNEPLDLASFYDLARIAAEDPGPYFLVGDREFMGETYPIRVERIDIVNKHYVDGLWDDYLGLLEAHKDIPIRVFTKEQFLNYANDDYIPDTPQVCTLAKWLENRSDSYTGYELAKEAVRQAEQDASAAFCMQELQRMGARFGDIEDRQQFVWAYQTVYETTPKCIHYGHTELELKNLPLSEQRKKQRIYAWWCPPSEKDHFFTGNETLLTEQPYQKVSKRMQKAARLQTERNLPPAMMDDCHCGSGLPYERCCGAR